MEASDCELLWRQICERTTTVAKSIDISQLPDLAKRAMSEADQFRELSLPTSGHELNLRRVAAGNLVTSWRTERSRLNSAKELVGHPAR